MARYIDADKLIYKIVNTPTKEGSSDPFYLSGSATRQNEIIDIINSAPTADVAPIVHGEWVDTEPNYNSGFRNNAHVCSNCHDYYTTEFDDLYYCPRCGAKMDGK